jgi:uncharacterized protein with HEPN domain
LRDDRVYLEYIHESLHFIDHYLEGASAGPDRKKFETDALTRDAVLHRLETLAEAVSHLSPELRARHPAVPWRTIVDFRNVLAHGYVALDLDLVWQTVTDDLPGLQGVIDQELD